MVKIVDGIPICIWHEPVYKRIGKVVLGPRDMKDLPIEVNR